MLTVIKNCALPECSKPFSNWRMACCCKSHQSKYSAKLRHGTLGLPNSVPKYIRKTPILTDEEKRIKRKIWRINYKKLRFKSMPPWADKDKINQFYMKAERLTDETGIIHEVDHIIPTKHNLVCGLHNEFNLQILTKTDNMKKSNKFEII